MEILSIGKRLRRLRKQLGIRQDEITGDKISRNLISMIENDKTSLTPKVAEILTVEINNLCKIKGIQFELNKEQLLETEESILLREVGFLREKIQNRNAEIVEVDFINIVISADNLLRSYKLYSESFDLLVEYERAIAEVDNSLAFALAKRSNELVKNGIHKDKVIRNYINLSYYGILDKKYDESIMYCKFALEHLSNLDASDEFALMMNLNISYSSKKDFRSAGYVIDKMLKIVGINELERNKALISKANNFFNNGDFKEANSIYKKIFEQLDMSEKYLVTSNLIDISIDNKEDLTIILREAARLNEGDESRDSIYLCKFYSKLAKAYYMLNSTENYEKYILRALNLPLDQRIMNDLILLIYQCIDYYDAGKHKNILEFVHKRLTTLVVEKKLDLGDKVLWSYMSFCIDNNKQDNLQEIIKIANKKKYNIC